MVVVDIVVVIVCDGDDDDDHGDGGRRDALVMYRYLTLIPSETISVYEKGATEPQYVQHPFPRSIEVIESALKVRCMIRYVSF